MLMSRDCKSHALKVEEEDAPNFASLGLGIERGSNNSAGTSRSWLRSSETWIRLRFVAARRR